MLRYGVAVGGGLSAVATPGAADEPDRYRVDVTGTELYVPCLGETIRVTQGVWNVVEDAQLARGNCWHYRFHFHYDPHLVVEGLDSGRVWSGQGSKNESLTVCPPYPATQTVTNHTTLTRETPGEDSVVQYRFEAHITVDATGDWVVTPVRNEFSCRS